ncbi:MAG: GAP family protein [Anaerolineales bacterium]|nr:GAP family protein [Anaerolineales bacterium]
MTSLLINLLPLSIASTIGPGQILFDILLLRAPARGTLKAISFVGGITAVRLLQGLLFGFILTGAVMATIGLGQTGVISSTLLTVLGIFLLISAYRQWREGESPDASPPKWLTMIDDFSSIKAFLIGCLIVVTSPNLWVFTLSAISMIGEAQLSQLDSIVAYLLFILVAETLVLVPILIRIAAPAQSTRILNNMSDWLTQHNHNLMIGVSLVFGLFFLIKGISGLLSF